MSSVHRWLALLAVAPLAIPACGSHPARPPAVAPAPNSVDTSITLEVATSDGALAPNLDDSTCTWNRLAYTVTDETGTVLSTGQLSTGHVTTHPPAAPYRCTTDQQVTYKLPAKFVTVRFANGQTFTQPVGSTVTAELG